MDFKDDSPEDFVLNKKFRKWILDPLKEDNLYWEEYLRRHPGKLAAIAEARKLVLKLPSVENKLTEQEKKILWEGIEVELGKAGELHKKEVVYPINSGSVIGRASLKNNKNTKLFYLKRVLVAATVLLFMVVSWQMYRVVFNTKYAGSASQEIVIKQNPWGQKSTLFLSDGTEVILNSGSSLKYTREFTGDERIVHLNGEAFFKVAKDIQKPFSVISGNISTTALGTSFNVKAFSGEGKVNVALVTGRVVVSTKDNNAVNEEIYLEPGEQADFDEVSQTMIKRTFDVDEVISWKEGIIYFEDASSREVFSYLEKWYGVKILEQNAPVKKWNYTGEFRNMDLGNVLNSIGFTMNFSFEKEDKSVTIKYLRDEKR